MGKKQSSWRLLRWGSGLLARPRRGSSSSGVEQSPQASFTGRDIPQARQKLAASTDTNVL